MGREPGLAETLAASPLTIQCHGVGGLSFGMALPENVEVRVDGPVNHGAGKALSGGTVVAQVMGDQAGYGAGAGVLMARSMGDRAAIRSYLLDCLVETTGDMSSCYRTGGHVFVRGYPSHYPEGALGDLSGYRPMNVFDGNAAMGPGIGGGMGSGVVILPTPLHEENVLMDRYAAPLCHAVPRPMTDSETDTLMGLLARYAEGISDSHLAVALTRRARPSFGRPTVMDPQRTQAPQSHAPVRHGNVRWNTGRGGVDAFAVDWEAGQGRLATAAEPAGMLASALACSKAYGAGPPQGRVRRLRCALPVRRLRVLSGGRGPALGQPVQNEAPRRVFRRHLLGRGWDQLESGPNVLAQGLPRNLLRRAVRRGGNVLAGEPSRRRDVRVAPRPAAEGRGPGRGGAPRRSNGP